ncbi:MAG: hypothetical protein ACL93V_15180 [Candidatus Electrothrix sp. YB6]
MQAQTDLETGQELARQGDAARQRFDNPTALAYYKKAHTIAPDRFAYHAKMIQAYNDIGEDLASEKAEPYFEQAVRHAEELQKKFPEKAESYYLLAVSYGNLALLRGSKEKVKLSGYVLHNTQKAIELNPNYADAYIVLGVYYQEVASLNGFLKAFARLFFGELPDGTYEDAVRSFQKALTLRTTSPVYTYFHLGRTYEYMDKPEQAEKVYRQALQLPETDHRDHAVKQRMRSRLQDL